MAKCTICGNDFDKEDPKADEICPSCLYKSSHSFDDLPVKLGRLYSGSTSKRCVEYNHSVYMLRCQQPYPYPRDGIEPYDLSPITEYIGSKFYKELGIPVQDVILGTFEGKLAILCSDRAYPKPVFEFSKFRNSILDDKVSQPHNGMSTTLGDIFEVIEKCPEIPREETLERFYTMFVIDAILGNTHRENDNWGFIYDNRCDKYRLYDVYSLGQSLDSFKSDSALKVDLDTDGCMDDRALNITMTYYGEGHIQPFKYIENNINNEYIRKALKLISCDTYAAIDRVLNSIPITLSETRLEWYRLVMYKRVYRLCRIKEKYHLEG